MPGPRRSEVAQRSAPGKRRWGLILAVTGALLVLVVLVLVAVAPNIAASYAPGVIERATARQIRGSVKVTDLSLGWFSPTLVGPVEIRDPGGKLVGSVRVASHVTLWKVLNEQWWSADRLDVGEIELVGQVDVERDAAGRTNLEQAIEPKPPAVAKAKGSPASSGGGLKALKGTLAIKDLDVLIREKAADGTLGPETGVRDLKGTIALNLNGGTVSAKAGLSGSVLGAPAAGSAGGGVGAGQTKVDLDATIKTGGATFNAAKLENVKLTGSVNGAPIGVIDALTTQGGALLALIGETADVKLNADGDLKNAAASLRVTSVGVNGGLRLVVKDGVVSTAPGAPAEDNTFAIASTAFLARLPATRDAIERAKTQIRLSSAEPPVQLSIGKLRLPLPASGAGVDPSTIDARGMGVEIALNVGAMDGRVRLSAPASTAASGAPDAPGDWRVFRVEPTTLTLTAADLAQPVSLQGAIRAAIDGQSGGNATITATLAGLLDANGHVRALQDAPADGSGRVLAQSLDANVQVQGVATALVQPLLAGMNLPIDLTGDVGPTLDAGVTARADLSKYLIGGKDQPLPPADVNLSVSSANLRAKGQVTHAAGVLSSGAEGVTLEMVSAGPMIRRLAGPSLTIDGVGSLRAALTDLSVRMDALKTDDAMSAIRAKLSADLRDLRVTPPASSADQPGQAPPQPLAIETANLGVTLVPGQAPTVTHQARLSQGGRNFASQADLVLEGLKQGRLPQGAGLDLALRMGARGTLGVTDVPAEVLRLAPGLAEMLDPASKDPVSGIVRGAIGSSASLTTTFEPIAGDGGGGGGAIAGTAATVALTTQNRGVGGEIRARVTSTRASIAKADLSLTADPATLNPALAQSAEAGRPAMSIAQPFVVSLRSLEPIEIPLKATADGGVTPDFAAAGEAVVAITSDRDIIVDNVAIGTDPQGRPTTTQVQMRRLNVEARAPISGLAGDAAGDGKQASVKAGAQVLRGADARIADVDAVATLVFVKNATGAVGPSLSSAQVALAGLDVNAIDAMLNQNGQLSGALGATADMRATVTPAGTGVKKVVASVKAPKLSGAENVALTLSEDRLTLDAPAALSWTPDPAFLNRVVLGEGKPGAPPATLTFTQAAPIALRLQRMSVAMSSSGEKGAPRRGPMKPGIFALDAAVSIPAMGATVRQNADAPGAQPTALGFELIEAAVKSGQQPGSIEADLNIARITGSGGAAGKASFARAVVLNLADSDGVIDAKKATFNLDADFAQFPTAIVDQLGGQKGLLLEALGPTLDLKAKAESVTLASDGAAAQGAGGGVASGRIDATGVSPRATARLLGDIRNGAFIQAGESGIKIIEIRPTFVGQLSGGLPVVKTVEKSPTDDPAVFQAETLRVPIDGDLRKLNGIVKVDPGVARFTTQGFLADALNAVGLKSAGEIGRRIDPFVVRFDQGVANYDQFRLPIGEFNIETRGKVDLVNRRIDCVLYTPLGLMTDRAVGLFGGGGLGTNLGVLDKATMFPWRLRGSMDNPQFTPDVEQFLKDTGKNLLQKPGEAIKDQLDKTIKDLLKPKDKPKK